MAEYRFRFLDKLDRVIAGHYSRCEDDDAARAYADVLAAQIGNSNIEISTGDRPVSREASDPLRATAVDNPRPPSDDRRKKVRRWTPGLHECPRCSSPDLLVVRLPIVGCLTCYCAYQFDLRVAGMQPSNREQGRRTEQ